MLICKVKEREKAGTRKFLEKVKRELEEIKATLKETSEINELKEEIKTKNNTLKEMIKTKDNKINELERRVEDLEQYTRVEDVIILILYWTGNETQELCTGCGPGGRNRWLKGVWKPWRPAGPSGGTANIGTASGGVF